MGKSTRFADDAGETAMVRRRMQRAWGVAVPLRPRVCASRVLLYSPCDSHTVCQRVQQAEALAELSASLDAQAAAAAR